VNESALLARLRKVCLQLPEVRETIKWGHPTFEAGKKIFAVLDHYEGSLCVAFRASPDRIEGYLMDERFFEAPYSSHHGWLCLRIDGPLKWREIEVLVRESYQQVALKRMRGALEAGQQARRSARRSSPR
jgi:predicted DNA-binding protein (MmcQ/YjbR family)